MNCLINFIRLIIVRKELCIADAEIQYYKKLKSGVINE